MAHKLLAVSAEYAVLPSRKRIQFVTELIIVFILLVIIPRLMATKIYIIFKITKKTTKKMKKN